MRAHIVAPGPATEHSGGVRKLYDHARMLDAAGHTVTVGPDFTPADLLVVPEIYGDRIRELPGVPKISLNQNVHNSWLGVEGPHPYDDCPDLLGVLCMSAHNETALRWRFPHTRIVRVFTSVGRPEDFRCGTFPRSKWVCYFARKKPDRAKLVLDLLDSHLDGWEVIAMDGFTDASVGATMRHAAIFLSFSELEGFGSPPLEAMACGCLVIGFAGGAGTEYLTAEHAIPIADDDVVTMAREVAGALDSYPHDATKLEAVSRWALDTYSPERERASVLDGYAKLCTLVAA